MKFQYAQPSQVALPGTVYAILENGTTIICVCLDLQSANVVAGYNSAYTIAEGTLVD